MDLELSDYPAPTTELTLLVVFTDKRELSLRVAKLLPGHLPTVGVSYGLGNLDDLVSSGGFTPEVRPDYQVPTNCLHLTLTGYAHACAAGHVAGQLAQQGWTLRGRLGKTLAELAADYALLMPQPVSPV